MTDTANMQRLREAVRRLALHENDFAAGDAVVERIAELKIAIDAFTSDTEPWLLEWLGDEHYKGAVLYAAGKMNWNHEQQGKGTFADRQMRARIISRFNSWVDQLSTRLIQYERGPRDAASVARWRSDLKLFKQDPVRND
ncbi:hypothetical protein [Arthrobacter sp. EpRS71]|uniref:hypothetical protein n=1 Tax=Arthrobacter sp. EpRS71 TaxID=1743141 RepID=UPI000747E9B7|nr:hypothetical protein [Arthrobacter sp. EpRS71]KUM35246.1 hypothetical protein AR689_14430 [Arthrobacter sp. EpRS71]